MMIWLFPLLLVCSAAFGQPKFANLNYVKILSLNVGGAHFKWEPPFQIVGACPLYKLCDSKIMDRVRYHIQAHLPDVIHLQEILDPSQLFPGSAQNPALLPKNYQFVCGHGAGGLKEVCTAWNTNRVKLQKPCRTLFGQQSGAVSCTLKIQDQEIDFINVHPSFLHLEDRRLLIQTMWDKLVRPNWPTVIAGDFNTVKETYNSEGHAPYPPNFETVFGRIVKGYGRRPASESGFGRLNPDGSIDSYSGTTIFGVKIDHMFVNFGRSSNFGPELDMPCLKSVCLGNHERYQWGPAEWTFFSVWGPMTDHLPILAKIYWDSSKS